MHVISKIYYIIAYINLDPENSTMKRRVHEDEIILERLEKRA